MAFWFCLLVIFILFDYNDLKNSNNKMEIVFYCVSMLSLIILGIIYFRDINVDGIAERVIRIFGANGG